MPGGAPIGNQNGLKQNRLWGDTIKRAVAQNNSVKLRGIADKLIELATAGDIQAIKELGDRLDGKPHQSIDASVNGNLIVEILKFTDAVSNTVSDADKTPR